MAECLFFLIVVVVVVVVTFSYLLKTAKNKNPLESNFVLYDSSSEGRKKEKMKAYFAAMSMVMVPGFLIMTSTDILECLKDAQRSGAMLLVLLISMVWGAVCLVMLFLVSHVPPSLNASPSIAKIAGSGADASADPAMLP